MERLKVEYVPIDSLQTYAGNAKIHTAEQVEQIKASINEFGFNDPIAVWRNEIVEGHGRYMACQELGIDEVPIIRLDGLTDEQRRAYTLVHNQLTLNTGFDLDLLQMELDDIVNVDMDVYDFGKVEIPEFGGGSEPSDYSRALLEGRFEVVVECADESEQEQTYNELKERGYKCRVLTL